MEYFNRALSGFCFGGEPVRLCPAEMRPLGDCLYSELLPGGCEALLFYREIKNAFVCRLALKNGGNENSARVTFPNSLELSLDFARGKSAVLCTLRGDSCGAESFLPLEFTLGPGDENHAEPVGGRSSNTTGFPFFDISFENKSYVFGIGWSGQWRRDVSVSDGAVTVKIGLCDADFYLKPGEEVSLPSVICLEGGEVSDARREFRALFRESFSPRARLGDKMDVPLAIQPFDRYFRRVPEWATEAGQLKQIENAAKCGHINTSWLDAAWFKNGFPDGVGNYGFEPGFPRGLRPVSDFARQNGMRFMLWFEPERVHRGTEVWENHPEMLLSAPGDENTKLFNLGDDAARAWLIGTLSKFIADNGIDIYRQDFNMDPLSFWRAADEPGRKGITEIKYINGLYRLWDALSAAFPGLLIDNCSSGGRRIDFETCSRALPLWRSDTGCSPASPERRSNTWSQNQILSLTRYIPYHACAVWGTNTYDFRSSETHGLACNLDILNPDFDFTAAERILAEEQRLEKYWDGDFYPLTEPTLDESGWCAWQLSLRDSGAVIAFRRENCNENSFKVRLSSVSREKTYRVTVTDEKLSQTTRVVSGAELSDGVVLETRRPRESVILEYQVK